MTPTEQQFAELQKLFPDAKCHNVGNGSHVITIPNIELPAGWNAPTTTVRFLAPVGFPASRPDCFWADSALRLANGAIPANTGQNQLPDGSNAQLWFSWHVDRWSPNYDTLLTYLNVIRARFRHAR